MAILSLAVGYIVGKAIRKGTGGLGGRRCQVMAVALTYFAIGLSYAPVTEREMAKQGTLHGRKAPAKTAPRWMLKPTGKGEAAAVVGVAVVAALAMILLAVAAFSIIAPLAGGVIGVVILLVGLAQAWKMTARDKRLLTGPFALGEGQPVG